MVEYRQLTYNELKYLLPPMGAKSVDTISMSNIDSKGTLTFHCSAGVLPSLLYTLVGDTKGGFGVGNANYGKLNRVPPLAHPYFPWLYCTAVTEITGQAYVQSIPWEGKDDQQNLIKAKDLKQSTAPLWNVYREYVVKAEFSQRSYAIMNDSEILQTESIDYYSQRNTSNEPDYAGIDVWDEWNRYCVVDYGLEGQFLTAEQGQFKLLSTNTEVTSQQAAVKGNIRQFRPGASIIYKWYGVPYEWLTGPSVQVADGPPRGFSVLDIAQGTINQHEFDGWAEGTLLFVGAKTTNVYNRPFPNISFNRISPARVCDLDLQFTFRDPRRRKEDEDPISGLQQHGSFVPRGNNTVPNARDGYNYPVVYAAQVDTTHASSPVISKTAGGQGIYPSFPTQFLFQDPAYIYQKIGGFLV